MSRMPAELESREDEIRNLRRQLEAERATLAARTEQLIEQPPSPARKMAAQQAGLQQESLNQLVGAKNILLAFIIMLTYEGVENAWKVYSAGMDVPCTIYKQEQSCTPQHENMWLGHQISYFIPWLLSPEHLETMLSNWDTPQTLQA